MVRNRKVIPGILAIAIIAGAFLIITATRHKSPAVQAEVSRSTAEERMTEPVSSEPATDIENSPATGRGMTAMNQATEKNKYLFAYFYKAEDEQTRKMKDVFDSAVRTVAEKADSVSVNIADQSEREIVNKYRLSLAPMPLAMVLAPNGAVTGAFPRTFEEKQLTDAIVSPCTEKCVKALQERKLVFLCVQNGRTKHNEAAMRGVNEFKADARFSQATEIITVDPSIEAEMEFLGKLKVKRETDVALTIFLAPPGRIIGTYNGATDKAKLEKMLLAVMSSCASGCGPAGCGPKK